MRNKFQLFSIGFVTWLVLLFATGIAEAFTAADADAVLAAHTRAFYVVKDDSAWHKETTVGGKASFWMRAEQMEMVLDAYERTTNPGHLVMFQNLFNGFVADYGTNWMQNPFNDDIIWMVIACARGSLLTGNAQFGNTAKANFDACYARAWSADLGGGLWWKTDQQSKNACVNGPAAIAAVLLSRAVKDPGYLSKPARPLAWERSLTSQASFYVPAPGAKVSMPLARIALLP